MRAVGGVSNRERVIWPAQFAANGYIPALSDRFGVCVREGHLDGQPEPVTYDGKIWGVPCLTDARMFYCKGHIEDSGFSELPKTWHETKDMAKKVRRRSGIRYGYVFQGAQDEDGVVADAPERVRDAGRRPEQRRGGRGQHQVGGGPLAAAEHDHRRRGSEGHGRLHHAGAAGHLRHR